MKKSRNEKVYLVYQYQLAKSQLVKLKNDE